MSAFRLIFFPQLFNAHEKKHERAHLIKYKVLNHYWLHFVPPIYCLCLHDNVMKCECVMPWNMQTVNERQARVTFNFFLCILFSTLFLLEMQKTTGNYTFDRVGWFVRVERNEKCKFSVNTFFTDENSVVEVDFHVRDLQWLWIFQAIPDRILLRLEKMFLSDLR